MKNSLSIDRVTPLAVSIAAALLMTVPALAQTTTEQVPATGDPVTELDKVVVRGVRAAQAEAINTKRDAAQIVD